LDAPAAALVATGHFSYQLKRGEQVENVAEMKATHFRRLFTVAGLGLLLAGAALSLQIGLSFGWALLLGMLAILCLSWLISKS
jgi:hypothetical protein